MVVGIILEINPFHNGHKKIIDYAKDTLKANTIIAITSTYFSMRGKVSPLSKKEKTHLLLASGVDLVFELPTIYALNSADYFAKYSIDALSSLGIDTLLCGSDICDLDIFENIYNISLTNEFKNMLDDYQLNKHLSLKEAFLESLTNCNIDKDIINLFSKPNAQLAYSYFKVIKESKLNIKLIMIKRIVDDSIINPSATSLCEMIYNNQDIDCYLPFKENFINLKEANKSLDKLIQYTKIKIDNNDSLTNYCVNMINSFNIGKNNELYAPNSNFTTSRIRRFLLKNLLDFSNIEYTLYLRLLGFNKVGLSYLNILDKDIKKIIFSSINELDKKSTIYKVVESELKASSLYSIISSNKDIIMDEYKLPYKGE